MLLRASEGCTIQNQDSFYGLTDQTQCKNCDGIIKNGKCTCEQPNYYWNGYTQRCIELVSSGPDCTSITKGNLKETKQETCEECKLIFNNSKCQCPTEKIDKEKLSQKVCETCKFIWSEKSKSCSQHIQKFGISFILLALLIIF